MKFCKKAVLIAVLLGILVLIYVGFAFGGVSPEEAAKLGTTLTGVGAEMAGNKDGTIPAYTGGLTKPPVNFKPGSGVRPDPYAEEKPLFSINAQNMAQYADKLTEGAKILLKRFPAYRIDVYRTHRTAAYPDYVLKNTAKNAVTARTINGGLTLRGAHAGVPFPIPKDGYEVMWNHLVRYQGRANDSNFYNSMVDASGRYILSANGVMKEEFPYYDEDKTAFASGIFFKLKIVYANPPRKNGEALLIMDYIDMTEKPRIVYQYLPGQRRTKLAPEIAFDTPDPSAGGTETCDDNYLFNGSMERFNFKLIGKREVFIPYNTYKATYQTNREDLFGPKHLNPDVIRWELHRVWVVEATIKPGKRHIYHKQRYYFDEDSWIAQATEKYDAHGNLFKVGFAHQAPSYDEPAPSAGLVASHNLFAGTYVVLTWPGPSGYFRPVKPTPDREWTPQAISGGGIR